MDSEKQRQPRESIPPTATHLLKQMEQLQDVRLGLAISSHRKAPLGPGLVLAKKTYRKLFQPFINELMRKQAQFNEHLVSFGYAVYRDLRSTDSAAQAMVAGLQVRIRRLEEAVTRLEARLPAPVDKGEFGPSPEASGNGTSTTN